MRIAH
jgi:hypothetical protein